MTTLNADETLLSYLSPLKEETVIRDASGKSTGRHAFAKTEAEHIANLKKYGYIK